MLILTRSIGEAIFIDDDTTVTVLGTQGNQARIGVAAPQDVEVHREEIYYRVHPDRIPTGKRRRMKSHEESTKNDHAKNDAAAAPNEPRPSPTVSVKRRRNGG